MVLTNKEKVLILIANGIAAYSIYAEKDTLPENQSLIDFIVKGFPEELKSEVTMDLIDEVFDYVTKSRMDS